eukprot:SAG31_NODE_2945_length_4874_cov_2.485864_2_plen_176_part_00
MGRHARVLAAALRGTSGGAGQTLPALASVASESRPPRRDSVADLLRPAPHPSAAMGRGNKCGIALLEHVNVNHSSVDPADSFFFSLLGMVPATYCSDKIIHANFGLSQMHVPIVANDPQTWSGAIGLAYSAEQFEQVWAGLQSTAWDTHRENDGPSGPVITVTGSSKTAVDEPCV